MNTIRVLLFLLVVATASASIASKPYHIFDEKDPLNDMYDFINFMGVAEPYKMHVQEGSCFKKIIMYVNYDSEGIYIDLNLQEPRSHLCTELLVFTTTERFHFSPQLFHGKHSIKIKGWKDVREQHLVTTEGMIYFGVSGNIIKSVKDFYDLYEVYKKDDWKTIRAQMELSFGEKFKQRKTGKVDLNPDDIPSGTLALFLKYNNIESYITFMTHSKAGHTALLLRNPATGQLFATENQPFPRNVFKTDYTTWVNQLSDGTYDDCTPDKCMMVLLPLSDEAQEAFDDQVAWDAFLDLKGSPYLNAAELFAVVDNSDHNALPHPLSPDALTLLATFGEDHFPAFNKAFIIDGANHRLGTNFDNMHDVVEECIKRDMTVPQLLAIPEDDKWLYKDPNTGKMVPALHCTSYVFDVYKRAGAFKPWFGDSFPLNTHEITPRDAYEMSMFKQKPLKGCVRDDTLPYCQVLGLDLVDFSDDFAHIDPYPHMDEHCYSYKHFPQGC
ncbi:hypothetical protein PCE1_003178 [Barthelona sp. PCE]